MDTMKVLLVAVIAGAICAGGVFALYKWPQPKDRQGGLNVLAAVKTARRLYAKAFSMLTKSAFETRDGTGRVCYGGCDVDAYMKLVASKADEDVICPRCGKKMLRVPEAASFREEMALDDSALKVLKDAQAGLAEVLKDNAHAEPRALALGHATMGRIVSLRAKFHAERAAKAWQKARDARNNAYGSAHTMGADGVRARYYNQLAALVPLTALVPPGAAPKPLETELAEAKKLQQAHQAEIQAIDAEIQKVEKTRTALLAANAKLTKEAEQLNTASQLATKAKVGLDKFEQAQAKEKEITRSRLEIDKIENQIKDLKAKRADTAIQLKNAEDRIAVADAILQDRKKLKGEHEAKVTADKARLAKAKGEIEQFAQEALAACKQAGKSCATAIQLYKSAEESFKKPVDLEPRDQRSGAMAARGDLLMDLAQVYTRQVASHGENKVFVDDIEKIWVNPADLSGGAAALPEVLRDLRGQLKQSGQVQAGATETYNKAIGLYRDAIAALSEKRWAWAYQGKMARAYMRLYQLSLHKVPPAPDTASRNEAKRILQEATQGKEASPFLKPLVEELESLP